MISYTKYNLVNDLGFVKTGVDDYPGIKKYFSTGSIKKNTFIPEGIYDYKSRPSRANREVSEGDVLQARMQDTNKIVLVDKELHGDLFSTGFFQFRPPKELIVPKYLYYFLSSDLFLKRKDELCGGSTQKAINDKNLSKIDIFLPPLKEQQRIVTKLDAAFSEIDEAIEVVNERYNNTNSLIATAQNALFEDMPLSIPRLKLSEAAKFENGDRGKNYPSKKYQLSEGIPFVNAGDFSLDGDITRDGMAYISEERFDLLGAGKFQKDDVLFCLRGSLGKSAINKTLKRGAIASSLVIIRALQDVYPDYLFAFIRSDIVKKYISETAGGTAQPNLSAKVVMGYEIPVPSLQEQEAIADKFWALRLQGLKAISLIKKKKSELMALKIAILTQELQSPESEVA